MSDTQATATGTLAATPLSQLLVYVLDKQLDGSFVFQTPDGARSALWVERGGPRKAKTAVPVVYLGRLLVELNVVDQETADRTLARKEKDPRLHGALLIEAGAIDEATLEVALGEQLLRQIDWLFKLPPQTAYGFYADKNYLERYGGDGADIEPLNAIWRGIRSYERPERVEAAVSRLGANPVRFHYAAQTNRFGFTGADKAIIDVIRARPHSLEELLDTGLADEDRIKRVVYMLLITRHFDLGAEPVGIHGVFRAPTDTDNTARRFKKNVERVSNPVQRAVVATPHRSERLITPGQITPSQITPGQITPGQITPGQITPGQITPGQVTRPPLSSPPLSRPPVSSPPLSRPQISTPPVSRPPVSSRPPGSAHADTAQMAALRAEVQQLKDLIPSQNYYEILGVERDAPTSAISAAFFQLAKKYHPDRLGRESASVREDAMKIFARMTEAHQVLADPLRRRDYDDVLQQGGGTAEEQEQVNRVMRAVIAHQKAQVLVKKQNYAEAEKYAKEAMEGDPEQPEYVALYVRIVAQSPERAQSQRYDDLLKLMNDAVDRDPENERVRFARGELYKRMGRKDEAFRDFRWCVAVNPRNVEAAREVRLHAIRAGEKPPQVGARRRSVRPPKDEKTGLLGKFFKR